MSGLYKGFSFNQKDFKLYDINLVEENILTHINTSLNTRVHMPLFGTAINDMIGENMDQETMFFFQNDISNAIEYDPRVTLDDEVRVIANYDDNTLGAAASMKYKILNQSDILTFVKRL